MKPAILTISIISPLLIALLLTVYCHGLDDEVIMRHAFKRDIQELESKNNLFQPSDSMETIVQFYLYTRENAEPFLLMPNDTAMLSNSSFDVNKPTKVLIHGFLGSIKRRMVQDIKRRFLETQDVNVLAVDWSPIAWSFNYYAIVEEVPNVGYYLAEMLTFLVSQGCDPKSFHLIGHSLGAHVAGFAGFFLDEWKIGRITGLDPAKPMYNQVDRSKRLDSTDADFVDCIHTCGGLLGLSEPICHVDFYPNGGRHVQPGCYVFDFGRCSHRRSYEYFAESILPTHKFPALMCKKFNDTPNDCTNSDVYMGNYVNRSARGVFFVHTNKVFPYAINS